MEALKFKQFINFNASLPTLQNSHMYTHNIKNNLLHNKLLDFVAISTLSESNMLYSIKLPVSLCT